MTTMPLSADQLQTLNRLLAAEVESAREMTQLLKREYDHLTTAEPDKITAIAKEKQMQLELMTRHSAQRERFLRSLALPISGSELKEQLINLATDLPIIEQIETLEQLLTEVKRQNRINGGVVSLGQRHTRQALHILSGQSQEGDTYGPGGEKRSGASTDPLAKA